MNKGRHTGLKLLGISLIVLPGFVLLVLVALHLVLHSHFLPDIALKILSGMVSGQVSFSDLRVNAVKTYSLISLSLDDFQLTYPHDRFDSLALGSEEGRYSYLDINSTGLNPMDTLLSVKSLQVEADVRELLFRHRLVLSRLKVDEPRVFVRRYNSENANWDILDFLNKSEKDSSSSSFSIREYDVGGLDIVHPRLVYSDAVSGLSASAAWDSLCLNMFCRPEQDSILMDGRIHLKNLDLGDALASVGPYLSPYLAPLSMEAMLDMDVSVNGWVHPDSLGAFPLLNVSVDIPSSSVSYGKYVSNASVCLGADLNSSPGESPVLFFRKLGAKVSGASLNASGKIRDLTGMDPLMSLDAKASADLSGILQYLPYSIRSNLSASGKVTALFDGSIRKSQLVPEKLFESSLSGKITGSDINVNDEKDTVRCYLDGLAIVFGATKSSVNSSDRAISLTARVDSADIALSNVAARGSDLLIFAQNSRKAIIDKSIWHPFAGKLNFSRVFLSTEDSLIVAARDSKNNFSVIPKQHLGRVVPVLNLESLDSGIFVKSPMALIAVSDATLAANAQMRVRRNGMRARTLQSKRMREMDDRKVPDSLSHFVALTGRHIQDSLFSRSALGDSLRHYYGLDRNGMPDFLSESDFRMSDISIKVAESVRELLNTWTPSFRVSASNGLFASPLYPLKNRFESLSASFSSDMLSVDSLFLQSGTSDIELSLNVHNLQRSVMGSTMTPIKVDASISSHRFNVDEILSALHQAKELDSTRVVFSQAREDEVLKYEEVVAVDSIATDDVRDKKMSLFVLPANLNLNLDVDAENLNAYSIPLRNVHTRVAMRERCIQLSDTRADSDMGKVALDAFYSTKTKKDLGVGFGLNIQDLDLNEVVSVFPVIQYYVPSVHSLKGKLDCEVVATTQIDTNMSVIKPSVSGMFRLNGYDVSVDDIGGMKKLTKMLLFKEKDAIRIKEMSVNGIISNNAMEIFPFILNVDRYVVALQGVQNMNKSFDYHMSVIESPLLFNLGVNLFGPSLDTWKFKVGRPKYRTKNIPLFYNDVQDMKNHLLSSIRNVMSSGADRAFRVSQQTQTAITEKKKGIQYVGEELETSETLNEIESIKIKKDFDDENKALSDEIDRLIEEML